MFRVVKKDELTHKKEIMIRISAVILALIFVAIVMTIVGYNALEIFSNIIKGSLSSKYRIVETINKTIPLTVLSLGVAIAFKMKFWNIGAEGQFYMGAFGATFVALNFSYLPSPVVLTLMFVAGAICGGLWALIPALLKTKFETSETLVTLMLNYIAIKWISYLQYGPWKDPNGIGFPKIATFEKSAVLPKVFGIHCGFIIALVLVVLVHILLTKTKLGYEISVLGESQTTAKYAGMNVVKIIIIAILLSGAMAGIAGMMQCSAIEQTLNDKLSGGLGFTAVITTWLANLSAPLILVVSFLFALLLQGGAFLQSAMQIPASVAEVIQGIIIFFVLASEFFIRYKIVRVHKVEKGAK